MHIPERSRPYLFGALSGLLLTASVALAGQFFGTSTTFPRLSTFILTSLGIDLSSLAFAQVRDGALTGAAFPNWQLLFVIGIGLGAFISARASGTFHREHLPELWVSSFGSSQKTRLLYSLAGGSLAMIGARMAGGCPSGHGVSGVSQLGVSSLLAMAMFFIGGITTARFLYASPAAPVSGNNSSARSGRSDNTQGGLS
ncbi:YeeE/YedE thiosulfate transporter family protein [Alkalispirochaeta alkalica]|uniref:YeeE/YedE thiosulfate transporter family protein n=1 Tax=Alkalispirochaeta alkalica TaxID=46356 RepID=UPI00035DA296|nr:YeeE/YedE thiosulfate transporter family protein [Alkalispirochaeta alkalica]